jgi:hypothetical protein
MLPLLLLALSILRTSLHWSQKRRLTHDLVLPSSLLCRYCMTYETPNGTCGHERMIMEIPVELEQLLLSEGRTQWL